MASVNKRRWTHNGVTKEAWMVRYHDPATGRHPGKTFPLKKDAEAFKRKVEREIEEGAHVARASSRTVEQTINEFLADLERRVAEKQVGLGYLKQTKMMLGYASPEIGRIVMRDLTWQQIEAYGRVLRQRMSFYYKRPLSPTTIRVALNCLNMAVDYGVRRGYAARNVVPSALKELGAMPAPAIETFSREEMRKLVATIEDRPAGHSYRMQAFLRAAVFLGAMCGLRRGEIMALTWDDIDFGRSEIRVRHNLTPQDTIKPPKTRAGRRTVPLASHVADALRIWAPFVVPEARGLIFRRASGSSWSDTSFYRDSWHKLLDRAGLTSDRGFGHRHFHALRHYAGSAWLEAAIPLPEVSRLLGHANPAITARVYSHAIVEANHRAPILDACAGLLTDAANTQELPMAA